MACRCEIECAASPIVPLAIFLRPQGERQIAKGDHYMQRLTEALRMLDAFASVGAHRFDVTFLDIDGQKRGFRAQQSASQLRNSLPILLPGLTERHNSLVVRPHPGDAALVRSEERR